MKTMIIPAMLSVAFLSGCSSIISKSDYPVAINSSPDGASFVVTNGRGQQVHSGETPATVNLNSSSGFFQGASYTVLVEKDGYSSKTYTINSSIDGWYFGNLLFGGLLGMLIIDPATGAMYNLPERLDVPLGDREVSSTESATLTIATIDMLSAEQRERLERIQ